MALIKCPECGKDVSDQSSQCIYCGYPLEQHTEISDSVNQNDVNEQVIGENDENEQTTAENDVTYPTNGEINSDSQSNKLSNTRVFPSKKIILGVSIAAIFILIIILLYYHSNTYYTQATTAALNDSNFSLAEQYANKITDEAVKKEYINKINAKQKVAKINNAKNTASTYLQSGDLNSALAEYQSIQNDTDVSTELAEIEDYILASKYAAVLRDSLRNPSSLQIYEVRISTGSNKCLYFDYSGENGFGGTTRSSVIFNGYSVYEDDDWEYSTQKRLYFNSDEDYKNLNVSIIESSMNYY